jgi:hypothetical protein
MERMEQKRWRVVSILTPLLCCMVWLRLAVFAGLLFFAVSVAPCRQSSKGAPAAGGLAMLGAQPAPGVREAAQRDLGRFLAAIPPASLGALNFSSPNELATATLGSPFQLFTLQKADLQRLGPQAPVSELLRPTAIWFFPVVAAGRYRTVFKVDMTEGGWAGTGIGNSDLAPSFGGVLDRWPVSQGYRYIFLRNYETLSEFVVLLRLDTIQILPLPTAMRVLGLKQDNPLAPAKVFALLDALFNRTDHP